MQGNGIIPQTRAFPKNSTQHMHKMHEYIYTQHNEKLNQVENKRANQAKKRQTKIFYLQQKFCYGNFSNLQTENHLPVNFQNVFVNVMTVVKNI